MRSGRVIVFFEKVGQLHFIFLSCYQLQYIKVDLLKSITISPLNISEYNEKKGNSSDKILQLFTVENFQYTHEN